MSIHRFAAKRDDNEPAIRARFAKHGWHTEQFSGAGMPDLLVWPPTHSKKVWGRQGVFVDVKMPGKKATKAQAEKWTALSDKGIPVHVASTEADVDAIVGGTATPWAPEKAKRASRPVKRSVMAPCSGGCGKRQWTKAKGPISAAALCAECRLYVEPDSDTYAPPRSTPVDAPALAAETFAPDAVPPCGHCGEEYDPKCYHRDAPRGAVSCRKDVHCIKHDGHLFGCQAISPRACTT